MNPDLLPDDIISDLCNNLGIDPGEDKSYRIIENMTPDQILERICTWNGLPGWNRKIKYWVESIYRKEIDDLL
jgi:hypothetical protein